MTGEDIAFIQKMIRTLPMSRETREIVEDSMGWQLHERHPRLVPDHMSFGDGCKRAEDRAALALARGES